MRAHSADRSAPTERRSSSTSATRIAASGASQRRPQPQRPLVLDRYRLHRRLGAGGFGTVWLARDERLERDVAIKIVPRERIVGGRLQREARAAARLSHPGIVTLYEAAVDDDDAYLVSELVRGNTLADLLDAGRLSDRDIVAIGIALCDALEHAHATGIVHRDVKPSNVLVPERPQTPTQYAKLTDFGVARVIGGDSLTRTGDVVGTAAYMAPEQAEGREAAAPADLYSLALVIYEALTGVNPVRTNTAAQRARRLGAHLAPLRRQRRELPSQLGCAIDLALRPRPRERGTVAGLRAALIESLPLMHDAPGVVTDPWPRAHAGADAGADADADAHAHAEAHAEAHADAREAGRWPSRGLAAATAALAVGWLSAHLLSPAPLAPAAAALLAALAVAVLPRTGWLILTLAVALGAAAQHRPGGALILALTVAIPVIALPRTGTAWPLATAAPALALLGAGVVTGVGGLAGAWPAIAARASRPWRRVVLGATGWLWLMLVAPFDHALGYLKPVPGIPHAATTWIGSVDQTASLVIRPLLSSGAVLGAVAWALAAASLPYITRNRSFNIAGVAIWSVATVAGTAVALNLVHSSGGLLAPGAAAVGAIAGALIALAPRLASQWRVARGRAGLS